MCVETTKFIPVDTKEQLERANITFRSFSFSNNGETPYPQEVQNAIAAGLTSKGPLIVIDNTTKLAATACEAAKQMGRTGVLFDLGSDEEPTYNPMDGELKDVVTDFAAVVRLCNTGLPSYFEKLQEKTLTNALSVLRFVDKYEDTGRRYANLCCLEEFLDNRNGMGIKLVDQFSKLSWKTSRDAIRAVRIAHWFRKEYFDTNSKTFVDSVGLRVRLRRILMMTTWRRKLCPVKKSSFNLGNCLMNNCVIGFTTSTEESSTRDVMATILFLLQLHRCCANAEMSMATVVVNERDNMYSPQMAKILALGPPAAK